MSDRARLLALADRVEAASGPSRELDAEIAEMLGWRLDEDEETREVIWVWPDDRGWTTGPPAFTASLDSALPNEANGYWEISGPRRYLNIPTPVPNYWRVLFCGHNRPAKYVVGWGATEAPARRAAALRALAQEAPGDQTPTTKGPEDE